MSENTLPPITDEAQHQDALVEIDQLMALHWHTRNPIRASRINVLAKRIEAYERIVFPIPEATPAEVLEHLREARGMSREDFAALVGLPATDLAHILEGQRDITADEAHQLGEYFAVAPSLFREDP